MIVDFYLNSIVIECTVYTLAGWSLRHVIGNCSLPVTVVYTFCGVLLNGSFMSYPDRNIPTIIGESMPFGF